MARWLVETAHGAVFEQGHQVTALLSMFIVFFVCLTMVVGLCAAHGNPQVLNRDSEPEAEQAVETNKGSQRFGPFEIKTKLGSFRKPSFRNPTSFRHSGSFRIDCKSQVDVMDGFQGVHTVEEDPNAEPAVWQRSILRGERCAPLAFSGLILYDEKGNPLNPDLVNNSRPMPSR